MIFDKSADVTNTKFNQGWHRRIVVFSYWISKESSGDIAGGGIGGVDPVG